MRRKRVVTRVFLLGKSQNLAATFFSSVGTKIPILGPYLELIGYSDSK